MADGRRKMADGRWKKADGRWLMADGRWLMAEFSNLSQNRLTFNYGDNR